MKISHRPDGINVSASVKFDAQELQKLAPAQLRAFMLGIADIISAHEGPLAAGDEQPHVVLTVAELER